MPSPFPGMNPYLEQDDIRHDFHKRTIRLFADLLSEQVNPNYIVRIAAHAPAEVGLPQTDVERLSFIEIRERTGGDVVTVVELLSPANKRPGPDREQYLAKRLQLLRSNTHFVEIDLLRGGPRLPLEQPPECDYYAMVSRVERRPRADMWPIGLRDPLPVIPVPLRAGDGDASLPLQAALNRVYDAARYRTYIYRGEPTPPLPPADAAWARSLIPATI